MNKKGIVIKNIKKELALWKKEDVNYGISKDTNESVSLDCYQKSSFVVLTIFCWCGSVLIQDQRPLLFFVFLFLFLKEKRLFLVC